MENTLKKELSVVIPTFNEKGTIVALIKKCAESLKSNGFTFEIIVIDDNSKDNTFSLVKKIPNSYKTRIFKKIGRKGKAYSLVEGFEKSKFENIAFIDADMQYPPEEIAKMGLKLDRYDVVCANRKSYNDSYLRKVLSRSFRYGFGKTLFGLDHDIQAGLKVFRKEVWKTISFYPVSSWTFDLEFLHKSREAGFTLGNHNISFGKRKKGDSNIGVVRTSLEIGLSALHLRLAPTKPNLILPITTKSMKGAGVRYKRKKYITHTSLPIEKSSIRTFTRFQKFLIALSVELTILGIVVNPLIALSIIIAVMSSIYFIDTLFNFFVVMKSLHFPQELNIGTKEIASIKKESLPIYTILCPLYKEAHIIPQFVKNISRLSWPKDKLDVILLLEEDDKDSINRAKQLNLPSFVRVLVVPHSQPKTKPKACNYGLAHAKGKYLVIFDAEDKPEKDQLMKAYISFQKVDKKVLCLQAKLNYYNPSQNLLTKFFTAEYSLWFDITLTGLQSIDTSIPLGGTSNHFRIKDLHRLQGWDPFNVTEDADLGMRLFKDGYKTAIINSTTYEEANSKWGNWIRQRSRWIKGYMQTYLVHTRHSVKFAKDHGKHFPLFHLIIGGKIAFILINPFLWVATISYFTLYAYVGPAIEKLYPSIVFYMAVFSLVFGNFLFMYYYMIGVMKREQYSLVKYVFLIPFYWLMISVAGFMALYQLFFKPFYWEKTVHGLHLLKKEKKQAKRFTQAPAFPRPVFPRPALALHSIASPFVVIGLAERKAFNAVTVALIFIGALEKRGLDLTIKGFKKLIVMPLKYAASMLT